jgi:hypothetical protein
MKVTIWLVDKDNNMISIVDVYVDNIVNDDDDDA